MEIPTLVWTADYRLLDGHRVYQTIHDFVKGKFPLDGITYDDMRQEQKIIFEESKLKYYEVNATFEDAVKVII